MRYNLSNMVRGTLVAFLCATSAHAAQRQGRPARPAPYYELPSPQEERYVEPFAEEAAPSQEPWTPWAEEGWLESDPGMPLSPAGAGGQGAGLYFGAEYLLLRPHYSESTAFVRETTVNDPTLSVLTDEAVNYPLDFQGSFRAYLGFRPCGCDSQFQVTYWQFSGDSTAQEAIGDDNVVIFDFLENIADQPGDHVLAVNDLTTSVLDIDFSKRLWQGGQGADPCACPCPLWDLTWSAGVRFAEVDREVNVTMFDAQNVIHRTSSATADFSGAGPRLGLSGRRFYGPCQRFALLANGHASLLVGDYDLTTIRVMTGTPEARSIQTTSVSRVIPVLEMELGGAYRVSQRFTVSAGYLVQAWFDLGMTEAIGGTVAAVDDSNILGFDGMFLRGEFDF